MYIEERDVLLCSQILSYTPLIIQSMYTLQIFIELLITDLLKDCVLHPPFPVPVAVGDIKTCYLPLKQSVVSYGKKDIV